MTITLELAVSPASTGAYIYDLKKKTVCLIVSKATTGHLVMVFCQVPDLVLNRVNNDRKSAFRAFSRSLVMVDNSRINEIVGNESPKTARTTEQKQDRQFGILHDEEDTILHVLKAPNSKRQEAVLKYLQKRKERTFEKKVKTVVGLFSHHHSQGSLIPLPRSAFLTTGPI